MILLLQEYIICVMVDKMRNYSDNLIYSNVHFYKKKTIQLMDLKWKIQNN